MLRAGILMDPIDNIDVRHDSSFAMLLEMHRRGYECLYLEADGIWLQDGITWGRMRAIEVRDDLEDWFALGDETDQPLVDLDFLLMRKDPPVNMHFINITYLLEQAEAQGLLVVNKPSSLRDANEKLFTSWFPHCCPKTLVTANADLILDFVLAEQHAVIKPLDSMGGHSVYQLHEQDPNLKVICENMTRRGKRFVMVQRFLDEIIDGDKRILMINGEPVPYALARIPAEGDFRGNLASGAHAEGRELTDQDRWICEQVGPVLREKGLLFVGLDVIGNYLTEINVTSPTCIRELDAIYGLNIAAELMDCIESMLHDDEQVENFSQLDHLDA